MPGLVTYGTYLPYHRLCRSDIGEVLGSGGGSGTRTVAGYDEDTTTLGAEAARVVMTQCRASGLPTASRLLFATTDPAYLDKTNANVIHAALNLNDAVPAFDTVGAVRSGVGAIDTALDSRSRTLVVLSDMRNGRPGSVDEQTGGDGAAALLFSGDPDDPIGAELVGSATVTEEFLERWRIPGAGTSRVWEERFGERIYEPLGEEAFSAALKSADLTPALIDHLVVAGVSPRAGALFARSAGVPETARRDDLARSVGNTGTAQPGVLLADALDRAEPGQYIALVVLADGAAAFVFRTTEHLTANRPPVSVADQIAAGRPGLRYATFLDWRGHLVKEGPRRPDPDPPYPAPSHRRRGYKFGLVGSRCLDCGTLHLPPGRICAQCRSADRMADQPMADVAGTIATYTVDHLAYTPSPPMIAVVIDLDRGGRFRCQLTDALPEEVGVGKRVRMTFRRLLTAGGIHNYFWKATLAGEEH